MAPDPFECTDTATGAVLDIAYRVWRSLEADSAPVRLVSERPGIVPAWREVARFSRTSVVRCTASGVGELSLPLPARGKGSEPCISRSGRVIRTTYYEPPDHGSALVAAGAAWQRRVARKGSASCPRDDETHRLMRARVVSEGLARGARSDGTFLVRSGASARMFS